jgi:hypothetical protein
MLRSKSAYIDLKGFICHVSSSHGKSLQDLAMATTKIYLWVARIRDNLVDKRKPTRHQLEENCQDGTFEDE